MPISIMLKPASSACNLKCEYCFYSSVADSRDVADKGMMQAATAERVIQSALDFCSDDIYFVFQGGEPLLCKIEFFDRFVQYANQQNKHGARIHYSLQTNGTLIDDEWCRLFRDNGFLVGVSLDGDAELNAYRRFADGSPAFDRTMRGIDLLKKYGVQFNVLSVLTARTAAGFRRSYRFFKSNGLTHLQYIPCLKPFDCSDDGYGMSCDEYAAYLNSAFKIYYNDILRAKDISIRQMDNYRLIASGANAEQCGMNGTCTNQFVVEGDGSVYPCDFYCTDEWYLGNINDSDFAEMYNSKKALQFIKDSFILKEECKTCPHFFICRGGGCKRTKESYDYCRAYKEFFSTNTELIERIAR